MLRGKDEGELHFNSQLWTLFLCTITAAASTQWRKKKRTGNKNKLKYK